MDAFNFALQVLTPLDKQYQLLPFIAHLRNIARSFKAPLRSLERQLGANPVAVESECSRMNRRDAAFDAL